MLHVQTGTEGGTRARQNNNAAIARRSMFQNLSQLINKFWTQRVALFRAIQRNGLDASCGIYLNKSELAHGLHLLRSTNLYTPFMNCNGRPVGAYVTVTGVTARKWSAPAPKLLEKA
jgi:hypothetical protein